MLPLVIQSIGGNNTKDDDEFWADAMMKENRFCEAENRCQQYKSRAYVWAPSESNRPFNRKQKTEKLIQSTITHADSETDNALLIWDKTRQLKRAGKILSRETMQSEQKNNPKALYICEKRNPKNYGKR